jgi:tetratricopeptide (TPR) repeat protein
MEPALDWRRRTAAAGSAPVLVGIVLMLASCLALAIGCERTDPLAEIRRQQNAGNMAGSVEPLRALVAEHPDDAEVLYLYGRALNATASPTEAMWALRGAMDDPEWLVPAGLTIAAGAYRTRNFTVALDAVERVLAAHPDNLDALLLRAQTQAARKLDYEQALADAERVLEAQPDNISAMEPRILALLGLDRIDEASVAMEELGAAIRETQLSSEGLAWHCATMAIFAQDGGHLELARERWAGCLEEFP